MKIQRELGVVQGKTASFGNGQRMCLQRGAKRFPAALFDVNPRFDRPNIDDLKSDAVDFIEPIDGGLHESYVVYFQSGFRAVFKIRDNFVRYARELAARSAQTRLCVSAPISLACTAQFYVPGCAHKAIDDGGFNIVRGHKSKARNAVGCLIEFMSGMVPLSMLHGCTFHKQSLIDLAICDWVTGNTDGDANHVLVSVDDRIATMVDLESCFDSDRALRSVPRDILRGEALPENSMELLRGYISSPPETVTKYLGTEALNESVAKAQRLLECQKVL